MPTWPTKRGGATSRAVPASRTATLPASPTVPASLPSGAPLPGGAHRGWLVASLLSLYVIWGSTYLAIRWALEGGMLPFLMSGARYTLAGALLFAVLWWRGAPVPTARQWGASALVGAMLLGVGNGGVVFAQQWVPSGVAALVVGSLPLWTALFGGLFGQWPGRAERWGLAIGFSGIVLLNLGSDMGSRLLPTLVLLVAPMSWALGSVWSRRLPMPQGLMSTAAQMLCGGAVLLGFSLLVGERPAALPTPKAMLAFLYLVTFGSLVGYSAYGYLLRHARPSLATSYAYVNPVLAVFLGGLLAGETLTPTAWLAMGAILGAVVLLTRKK